MRFVSQPDLQVHLGRGLDQCGHLALLARIIDGQNYTTFRILVVVLGAGVIHGRRIYRYAFGGIHARPERSGAPCVKGAAMVGDGGRDGRDLSRRHGHQRGERLHAPHDGQFRADPLGHHLGGHQLQHCRNAHDHDGGMVERPAREEQGMAMAIFGMGVVLAPAMGPILGGWLTDNYGWPWVFYINIPVSIVGLVLVSAFVEDPPYLRRGIARVDWAGIGLLTLGLTGMQVVLERGQENNWFQSRWITAGAILTVVALTTLVLWELRTREP